MIFSTRSFSLARALVTPWLAIVAHKAVTIASDPAKDKAAATTKRQDELESRYLLMWMSRVVLSNFESDKDEGYLKFKAVYPSLYPASYLQGKTLPKPGQPLYKLSLKPTTSVYSPYEHRTIYGVFAEEDIPKGAFIARSNSSPEYLDASNHNYEVWKRNDSIAVQLNDGIFRWEKLMHKINVERKTVEDAMDECHTEYVESCKDEATVFAQTRLNVVSVVHTDLQGTTERRGFLQAVRDIKKGDELWKASGMELFHADVVKYYPFKSADELLAYFKFAAPKIAKPNQGVVFAEFRKAVTLRMEKDFAQDWQRMLQEALGKK